MNLSLPDDVAEYIAAHLKQNIRQLEGAVKKLNAYYMLEGIAPCIGVTTTAIKDTLNDTQPIPVTIEKIINEVARTYNVMPSDIRGKKRNANVSAARQMTMYIVREITGMSMEAIGNEFGRDHSTVVYSINTMERNLQKDRHLKEMVDDITRTSERKKPETRPKFCRKRKPVFGARFFPQLSTFPAKRRKFAYLRRFLKSGAAARF